LVLPIYFSATDWRADAVKFVKDEMLMMIFVEA
jgi:hypothetical protein